MPSLAEQYRPRTLGEIVGQDKAVKIVTGILRRGIGGRSFWITGATGTGKTTLARIIASEIADPINTIEIDAGELTPARVRELWAGFSYYGMGAKSGRALIVNEAHRLKAAVITALLVELERIPDHAAVLFTTTTEGADLLFDEQLDAKPFCQRSIQIGLARRDIGKPFAARALDIARAEGLADDTVTLDTVYKLVQREGNSMRGTLQAIEAGALLN